MIINIIAAIEKNMGIGLNGFIPWGRLKEDLNFFKYITINGDFGDDSIYSQNAVVMGRKTWESLPEKYKPLPYRKNIVMSRSMFFDYRCQSFEDINDVIQYCSDANCAQLMVIGGAEIYELFLDSKVVKYIYLTRIDNHYKCDRFFPKFYGEKIYDIQNFVENGIQCSIEKYKIIYDN